MTKLNITNKTIYKLKKNKNQSKKKAPKKRKHGKRKHKNGRSFRKRRRKYNIKNNSIKKYKKQRGGAGETNEKKPEKPKKPDIYKTTSIVAKEQQLQKLNEDKGKAVEKRAKLTGQLETDQTIVDANKTVGEETTKITKYEKNIKGLQGHLEEVVRAINDNTKRYNALNKKVNDNIKSLKIEQSDFDTKNGKYNEDFLKGLKSALDEKKGKEGATEQEIQKATDDFNTAKGPYDKWNAQEGKQSKIEKQKKINNLKKEIVKLKHDYLTKSKVILQTLTGKKKEGEEGGKKVEEGEEGGKKVEEDEEGGKKVEEEEVLVDIEDWKNIKKQIELGKILNIIPNGKKVEDIEPEEIKPEDTNNLKIDKRLQTVATVLNTYKKRINDMLETNETDKESSERVKKNAENAKKGKIKELNNKIKLEDNKIEKTNVWGLGKKTGLNVDIEKTKTDVKKEEEQFEKDQKMASENLDDEENFKKTIKEKEDELEDKEKEMKKTKMGYFKKKRKKEFKTLRGQKNWAKAGLALSKMKHSEFKSTMIKPHISDDVLKKYKKTDDEGEEIVMTEQQEEEEMNKTESFQLLNDVPYISSDNDDVYAKATKPGTPNYGEPFYNYYLKKIIKTEDKEAEKKELTVYEMIEQRKERFLKWLMHKEKQIAQTHVENLKAELEKFEGTLTTDIMRNSLNEKIIALTFLKYIVEATDDAYILPVEDGATPEEKKKYEEELKKSRFERSMIDLHKTTIDEHSLFKLFSIYVPGFSTPYEINGEHLADVNETEKIKQTSMTEHEIIGLGLDRFNGYAHQPCPQHNPTDDDDNYLKIAISRIRGEEVEWPDIKKFKDENDEFVKEQKENTEAEQKLNEIKDKKDKALQELVSAIQEIRDKFKIPETGAEITKKKEKVKMLKTDIEKKKLGMDKEKLTKIKAQQNLLEKTKKDADDALEAKDKEIATQQHDIESKGKDIENLEKNLEAQRKSLEQCNRDDAETKEQLTRTITQLEAEKKRMEEERAELNEKIITLGQEKEDAVKAQDELSVKITETIKKEEALESDIRDRETPTRVSGEGEIIDSAEEDEDSTDKAIDDATKEEGIDLDLENDDEVMVYIRRNSITGDLEIATSKLPGENISNWLMGAQEQDGAGK